MVTEISNYLADGGCTTFIQLLHYKHRGSVFVRVTVDNKIAKDFKSIRKSKTSVAVEFRKPPPRDSWIVLEVTDI